MYCDACGAEVPDGAKFCPACGKRLVKNKSDTDYRGNRLNLEDRYGSGITKIRVPDEKKSPGVAAALGFFLGWIGLGPLGYGYLGQWNWFWITFVVEIIAYPLSLGLAYIVLPIIFAIHQHQMAKDINSMIDELSTSKEIGMENESVD